MQTVRSSAPETILFPSGENAMDMIVLVWFSGKQEIIAPVSEFQMRIVRSPDPDATCLPSGENTTEVTMWV
jgi:hypothetical protein